jgi:hypothetical protein
MPLLENPLTAVKARQIAEWIGTCDKVVLAMLEKDTEITAEQKEAAKEFFEGGEMQDDLNGYADWYETHEGDTHDEVR